MLKNMKIGAKLVLVGTLVIAVPLVLVAFVSVTSARASLGNLNDQQLLSQAVQVAQTIDQVYSEELKIALGLANNPVMLSAAAAGNPAAGDDHPPTGLPTAASTPSELMAAANAQLAQYRDVAEVGGAYEGVVLLNQNGFAVASSDPNLLRMSFSDRDYFKTALAGKPNVGYIVISKISGKPITPVAVPVAWNGSVYGVIVLMMKIDFLEKMVAPDSLGRYTAVVDPSGLIVAHPKADLVMKLNVLKTKGMESLGQALVARRTTIAHYTFEGSAKTAATAPVVSTGWSVAYTISDSSYLGAISKVQSFLLVISAAALLAALAFYLLFARSITVPLAGAVSFARTVSAGDFASRLDVHQGDEIGTLADALNGMSEKLSQMFFSIQQNAELLASSSEQLSQSALKLSEGAQRQASSLEETSASVEELSASVDQVAGNAQSQALAAERGNGSMTHALGTVDLVQKRLEEISSLARKSADNAASGAASVKAMVDGITTLAESSTRIGGIVTVISEIADQTNLLALNASIEAARAGEHGRGFAVVADEVSKLAERSSSSTKEIESLIRESVRRVSASVTTARSSEEAIQQIRDASEQVSEMIARVAEAMAMQVGAVKDLADALRNVNEMSQSISASTEEQTTNARQVARAIEEVNEITQESATAAEQMSASTEQLSQMAQQLQDMVGQFRIRGNGERLLASRE